MRTYNISLTLEEFAAVLTSLKRSIKEVEAEPRGPEICPTYYAGIVSAHQKINQTEGCQS